MVVDYYLGPGGANAGSGQRDLQPHPAAAPAAQPRDEVEQGDLPAVLRPQHRVRVRDVLGSSAMRAVPSRHEPWTMPRTSEGATRTRGLLRRRLTLPESPPVTIHSRSSTTANQIGVRTSAPFLRKVARLT